MLPSLPSFVEQIANCASQKLRRVGWEVVRPELQDPTRNVKWPEYLEVCPPPLPRHISILSLLNCSRLQADVRVSQDNYASV
jgi:hypothetical protein